MATLLMRTPELAGAEKLAIANVEHAWQHNEKALGHGEQEGQHKTSAEVRSRARKGKSGQKKQPQRGLGVAQLEKLRLQEQSKQEAACLTSLQSFPSMGFIDKNKNEAIYFRHIKGAISHHHTNGRGSALAFGNDRLGPPDKLAEYLAREGHRHAGKGTMDEDVFRSFMSLASTDHSKSVSLSRHERGHSVSIMLPRRKGDSEMSFLCNNHPQAVTLGNNVHPSPSSVNNPGTEGSPARPASPALAFVVSPPNSSVRESSFFSSELVSRASLANRYPSNAEIGGEKRSSAELDTPNESVPQGFTPVSNTNVMEVGIINAKLLPVFVTAGAWAPMFTLTNLQCFESSSGPANVGRLPRENTNVPVVVGVTANCDRPKELSSVQSFSSNHSGSALNKSYGWKRPWQALHESTCKLLHSNSDLDLNALAGEIIDAADKDCGSGGVAQGQQSAVEAHHTEGVIRTASEDFSPRPLKSRMCGTWDENRSSKGAAVRDVGFYSDESLLKGHCSPDSKSKDSCSSVFLPSSLNRRRCLSSPEIQLLSGSDHQKSGDFLTLGLSSYSAYAQHEVEVISQEALTPEGINEADICSKEGHDVLQLQMCSPQQAQKKGSYSSLVSNEFISGGGPTTHARLSYRFTSLSSGSLTEQCHRQTGRKMEESLDLRLKLAL